MNRIERTAERPSLASGRFATFRAFLRSRESGALAVAAVVVGTLALAPGASAAETKPPVFLHGDLQTEVFSTRANIEAVIDTGDLVSESRGEYITAKALEEAEAKKEEAKWIVANETNGIEGTIEKIYIAATHLSPDTAYYERFVAKNKDGEATEKAPFKTLPVAKPEVLFTSLILPGVGHLEFAGEASEPTTAAFRATIEGNGAETKYEFEYAESAEGPWKEFTSDATGTISIAQEAAAAEASVTGLRPETTYYVRLKATNEKGTLLQSGAVTTPTAKAVSSVTGIRNVTTSSAVAVGSVEPHGSETSWRFEYSESLLGDWTLVPGAEGVISSAQAAAAGYNGSFSLSAHLTGLNPSTKYYVRVFSENAEGEGEVCNSSFCEPISASTEIDLGIFKTSGPPSAMTFAAHQLQGESLQLLGGVNPNSTPTSGEQTIAIEGAPTGGTFALKFKGHSTSVSSAGTLVSGSPKISDIPLAPVKGTGTIECTAFEHHGNPCFGDLEVKDATASIGKFLVGEPLAGRGIAPGTVINRVEGATLTLSTAVTESVSDAELTSATVDPFLVGEALTGAGIPTGATITETEYVLGGTGFTATLTLSADASASASGVAVMGALPYDASSELVGEALGLRGKVSGPNGGPYTVLFGNGEAQPQIEEDGSGLTPSGSVKVETSEKGGEGNQAHYRFQYVSQQSFGEHGWADAEETPEVNAGFGSVLQIAEGDLPVLPAGETYHYRLLVTSTAPGTPSVEGAEQTLTVPTPPTAEPVSCPNEASRTGLSAHLPDCRAYEMLSPGDKEGAQEPWQYLTGLSSDGLAGEDGEHFALQAPSVRWGGGPGAGGSPYFFTREAGKAWTMKAGTPQPETGVENVYPQMYSADLSEVAFYARYDTSPSHESADVEYKVGPAGGPYTTVASLPLDEVGDEFAVEDGWVGANGSFSKLVFKTIDHALLGEATGTVSGADLYEYTAQGGLRQLNVSGEPAATIGTCGAILARGQEEGRASSPHSVSADGSRVFFYAAAGNACPTAGEFSSSNGTREVHGPQSHIDLYMRVDGDETVDIGAYKFLGANVQGTRLLLENGADEVLGYDVETRATEAQSSDELATAQELKLLGIPAQTEAGAGVQAFSSPRYTYWSPGSVTESPFAVAPEFAARVAHDSTPQVYRYDNVEHVVQCISCASSFDPDPKQPAFLQSNEDNDYNGGPVLGHTSASTNGEFAFFTTPAALVPQDVDGEIEVEPGLSVVNGQDKANEYGSIGGATSPSSDIYEWRAPGVTGCAQVQGCLALITDGRGGFMNLLLGSADEGRDVFIYTRSRLLPQDNDSSGDIYDARVDGGLPGPLARPTECEGDACSTPASPPNDSTPSSLTFSGIGNVIQQASPKPVKSTKSKTKKKVKKKKKMGKKSRKKTRKAKRSAIRSSNDRRGK